MFNGESLINEKNKMCMFNGESLINEKNKMCMFNGESLIHEKNKMGIFDVKDTNNLIDMFSAKYVKSKTEKNNVKSKFIK